MSALERILESIGSERRIRYGLERFKEALSFTGNPEKNVHSLVIGGTNGKGSTTLFVSSALAHHGFKVATFLSPHLQSVQERFLWNLRPASMSELDRLAVTLEPVAKRFELTYFEFLTLLFFHTAKDRGADFLVLEVGLGGRLDATNVTRPIACAITNIAKDHEAYLGSELTTILDEKMGILRPESLLFTGVSEPELMQRIEKRCADLDAIYYYSSELRSDRVSTSWSGHEVKLNGFPFHLSCPSDGTLANAALAFLLLRITFPKISMTCLQEAFARVRIPGRLEVVAQAPRVVLSGDHNPAGIESLRRSLEQLPCGRIRTIAAFSPDKPADEMESLLRSFSYTLERVGIERYGGDSGLAIAAIERALEASAPEDTVLVTGSLYLVGEVRSRWRSNCEFFENSPTI